MCKLKRNCVAKQTLTQWLWCMRKQIAWIHMAVVQVNSGKNVTCRFSEQHSYIGR